MKKPETMPLYIAISPIGVFLQSCVKCGHDQFKLIDDNTHLACAKCEARIAKFDAIHTAALGGTGQDSSVTLH